MTAPTADVTPAKNIAFFDRSNSKLDIQFKLALKYVPA
jgi:hypothetical protein